MSVELIENKYGKSRVRLMKVLRRSELRHEIQDITVNISFEGEFTQVHTEGDNSRVLPTDTMKNTVYALAAQTVEIEEIEAFAIRLARYFLAHNPQVRRVTIEIDQRSWNRIETGGEPIEHAFTGGTDEKRTTRICATPDDTTVESGIENLIVLKTTRSAFAGFIKDRFTTLPEAADRVFCTSVKALWRYAGPEKATGDVWNEIRNTILEVFAGHDSLSVQHTLYAMGETVLEKFPEIAEISFSLPNIHCLPVDLERLGLEKDNRIFMPTDEPYGLIEARLKRGVSSK